MPSYVILNDDYLSSGYVDSTYVGTDSDLYIASGYIEDAIEGIVAIASSTTVTAQGGFLITASADASSNFALSVNAGISTTAIASSDSAFTIQIDADVERHGTSNSSSVFSILSNAVKTIHAEIDQQSAFTTDVFAVATVDRSADITVSATTTSVAVATKSAIVDIQAFQTHPTLWGDDVTWDSPVGTIWGPMVEAIAVGIVKGESSIDASFAVSVDGDTTAIAIIEPAAVASVEVFGQFEVQGRLPNLASSATVDVTAQITGDVQNLQINSAFTVESSGIFQVAGSPFDIDCEFNISVDADVIRDGVSINAGEFSVDTDYIRIRPFASTISTAFSLTANADAVADGISIVASAGTLEIDAIKTTDAVVNSSAAFTVPRWVGGILFGGIIDIDAFATTVSVLTIYNIDPYRVYVVDSETRLLGINQETRIYPANNETRVNTIELETRLLKVPSETRILEVQPLELVELSGIKDRRTG